jgi:NNP family nitrate/nitrite transporter-like MFS transporter
MIDKACPSPERFGERLGAIVILTVMFFLNFISRIIFAPMMPTIEQDLGLTHSQAGSLFFLIGIGFFISTLGSGFVSQRLTHRRTIMLSAVILGLTLLSFSFSTSLSSMRPIMIMIGLGAGLYMPSGVAIIAAMVRREDLGKALGLHSTAPSLGFILAPFLTEALMSWFGWRGVLAILGGVSVVAGIMFVVFEREGDFPGEALSPETARAIVTRPSLWIMITLFSLAIGGSTGIFTMLPLFLVSERGFDHTRANTLVGFSRISSLFMSFAAGWLTDRVGEKRAIFFVLLLAGVFTILLGMSPRSWVVAFVFLQPPLAACFFPPGFTALSRISEPHLRSTTISLNAPSAFLIGAGVVPALIGFTGEVSSFSLGIAAVGGLMVLGPVIVRSLKLMEFDQEGC